MSEKRSSGIIKLDPVVKSYIWGEERWLFSSLQTELKEVPFLIKEILSKEALSLQVHPTDEYAKREGESCGKTEMWYILDCLPDSFLYYGLKHMAAEEEIKKRTENGSILEICQKVSVNRGDVFFIPAGIIHAIGPGIRLLEVQQNSSITYRIYDYDRKNAENQPRKLHLSQALEVSSHFPPFFGREPMGKRTEEEGYARTLLVQCPYFKVFLYEVKEELVLDELFTVLIILEGEGQLCEEGEIRRIKEKEVFVQEGMGCRILGRLKLAAVERSAVV